MNPEKITVVSGEPRSGTSLMMKTLKKLGVNLLGAEFPVDVQIKRRKRRRVAQGKRANPDITDEKIAELEAKIDERMAPRKARQREMNPGGFFEVPGVVMRGLRKLNDTRKGKAIKLITNALCYRSGVVRGRQRQAGTPVELIDRVIYCLRDPRNIAVSQQGLMGGNEVMVAAMNGEWDKVRPISPWRYVQGMTLLLSWMAAMRKAGTLPQIRWMDYEDMLTNRPVQLIAQFLKITPTPAQLQAARDNIDPTLFRSFDFPGWLEGDEPAGLLAVRIYEALKAKDTAAYPGLRQEAIDVMTEKRRERMSWFDTTLWISSNPPFHRSFVGVPELNAKIREGLAQRRKSRMIPDVCKHFAWSEEYDEVQRPADLGVLQVKQVKCGRDGVDKPPAACKHCWQYGSLVGSTKYMAERTQQS